jgi:hypothetical protein
MTGEAIGMRTKRWLRYVGVISCSTILGLIAPGFCAVSGNAAPMQLTYQVTHSTYGNIGTYSNAIEPGVGGATTVQTQAHIAVKVLGVTLHREDAQRTERWQGNRLISFAGVTNKGGAPVVVRGEARGDNFVINSPQGTVTAPATVHPANPWSANFLSSNTMMRPDSGKLERVRVSGGGEVMVEIDGRPVRARRYEVTGESRYAVWIDDQGVPIKFAADDGGGEVTFTLASCTGCGVIPAMQQMGMK